MFNPFVWYQNFRLEKLRLKYDAQNKPFETLVKVVEQMSAANTSHAAVLQEWLSGFKSTEIPKSSIIRDEDEYRAEQERLISSPNSELNPAVQESIRNALSSGAFPELRSLVQ